MFDMVHNVFRDDDNVSFLVEKLLSLNNKDTIFQVAVLKMDVAKAPEFTHQ